MRTLLFAAALSLGGAAIAQSTAPDETMPPPSGVTVDDPSQSTGPRGETQQGTDPSGTATPPPGTNMGLQGAPSAAGPAVVAPNQQAFAPRPATQDYPPCSKTVTDGCIQTYERGVGNPD